ncbi:MauE/DoxX family redox-associated membrane protein [Segniliparus rugosus]|uniref:MauE/DoxX family redox-associated membrane protein n=1 Tax=Segniliparus rugosus TaxID=286804 RepID=UPI003CC6F479
MSLAARLGLAAVWLFAGVPKLLLSEPELNEIAVSAFRLLPDWAVRPVAAVQPGFEVALGVALLIGFGARAAAALSALLLAGYIAGIVWVWAHGYQIDCGCFSQGGEDPSATGWGYAKDIARDAGFLALALWLVAKPRSWAALGPGSRLPLRPADDAEAAEDEPAVGPVPLESSPAPAENNATKTEA